LLIRPFVRREDVIDASTSWEMPELYTSTNGVWRIGDERYPSYVNFHKEPLVRVKLSGDGKTLLVIACNPHNQGVEKVAIRNPGQAQTFEFELVGDWPIIKRFPLSR
jgi:hypothetical protein